MRAARVLVLMTLLVSGLAGTSFAQYSNATGTFDAKIGVVPGALPDGGAGLPSELQNVGPDLYVGQVTVWKTGGGYAARFVGEREDGASLRIIAMFSSDWAGLKFGGLTVGSNFEEGVITGIDVAHLLRAQVNGVGTVDGANRRVIATLGAGGTVERFQVVPAPGRHR